MATTTPVSKDGSRFDPVTCRRNGGYWVGPKGHEQFFVSFDDALMALADMEKPRWRRPNPLRLPRRHWGLVTGTHWEP